MPTYLCDILYNGYIKNEKCGLLFIHWRFTVAHYINEVVPSIDIRSNFFFQSFMSCEKIGDQQYELLCSLINIERLFLERCFPDHQFLLKRLRSWSLCYWCNHSDERFMTEGMADNKPLIM